MRTYASDSCGNRTPKERTSKEDRVMTRKRASKEDRVDDKEERGRGIERERER